MDDQSEEKSVIGPEDIRAEFESAIKNAEQIQEDLIDAAQNAGYIRAQFQYDYPFYIRLAELAQDTTYLQPFVESGFRYLQAVNNVLSQKKSSAHIMAVMLNTVCSSASTFTSGSMTLLPEFFEGEKYDPPPYFAPNDDLVKSRLAKIDPILAKTYQEIGQVFHGTTADPSRAALPMMRQVADFFFRMLAPNEEVRDSPYWKPKDRLSEERIKKLQEDEEKQVYRAERMTFAANIHIKDENRKAILIESIRNFLHTYKLLNEFHGDGQISESQAQSALKAMKSLIEEWSEAVSE